jgi:hypothetical protein
MIIVEDLMPKTVKQILFWTPRLFSILFILFLSLFALDVFGEGYGFWETVLALFMHLIPSLILVAALILAWRWEWIGAVLFIGFGVLYLVTTWGRFDWIAYLVIAGVPILVGVLFLIGWIARKQIHVK